MRVFCQVVGRDEMKFLHLGSARGCYLSLRFRLGFRKKLLSGEVKMLQWLQGRFLRVARKSSEGHPDSYYPQRPSIGMSQLWSLIQLGGRFEFGKNVDGSSQKL